MTKQRAKLIEKQILTLVGDVYEFTCDHEFNSPSLAAGVLVGGSASGPAEWKNKNGKSLKDIEA